jgi:hypothetical protein
MTFHHSAFGKFGDNIEQDMDGNCHTTAEEWMYASDLDISWEIAERCAKRTVSTLHTMWDQLVEYKKSVGTKVYFKDSDPMGGVL